MPPLKFTVSVFIFCLLSQSSGQKICDHNERRDYTDGKCCRCISINSPCNSNDTIDTRSLGFNCNDVESNDDCLLQDQEDIFNSRSNRKKRAIRIREEITFGNRNSAADKVYAQVMIRKI